MHRVGSMPGQSSATLRCCLHDSLACCLVGSQHIRDHRIQIAIRTVCLRMIESLCMQAASSADCHCARPNTCGAQQQQGPAASAPSACACTLQRGHSAAKRAPAAPSGAASAAACPVSGAAHRNSLHCWAAWSASEATIRLCVCLQVHSLRCTLGSAPGPFEHTVCTAGVSHAVACVQEDRPGIPF